MVWIQLSQDRHLNTCQPFGGHGGITTTITLPSGLFIQIHAVTPSRGTGTALGKARVPQH